jgi:hypothetical protein
LVRFISILLLAIVGFGPIASAFASGPESKLPVCCRRDGKHHCAKPASAGTPLSGAAFGASSEKCPLYPEASAPGCGSSFVPSPGRTAALNTVKQKFTVWTAVRPGLRLENAHSQRGPPFTL